MDELAIRLYREAIRRLEERGVGPEGTITVRDLFEEVVPYASVREPLGFELKADYDHALLQLLASPDSPLGLEPGEARDAVRRELEGATPDPHVVRDHSDARVRFVPAVVEPEAPAPASPASPASPAVDEAEAEAPGVDAVKSDGRRSGADPGGAGDLPDADGAAADVLVVPPEGRRCGYCSEPLPPGRVVRYCPFCGRDQLLGPCPQCNAEVERGWRYCIRCGTTLGSRA